MRYWYGVFLRSPWQSKQKAMLPSIRAFAVQTSYHGNFSSQHAVELVRLHSTQERYIVSIHTIVFSADFAPVSGGSQTFPGNASLSGELKKQQARCRCSSSLLECPRVSFTSRRKQRFADWPDIPPQRCP